MNKYEGEPKHNQNSSTSIPYQVLSINTNTHVQTLIPLYEAPLKRVFVDTIQRHFAIDFDFVDIR